MKRLLFLACLVSLIVTSAATLRAQDRRYGFVGKYLDDPYSTIDSADTGFSGEVYGRLQDLVVIFIYTDRIEWRDPGQEGRADLVIPAKVHQRNGGPEQKVYLVFRNTRAVHDVPAGGDGSASIRRQHWNPVPEVIPAPELPNTTAINVIPKFVGDLNGDGLSDRATLTLPGRMDNTAPEGIFIKFENVQLNLGFKLVQEADVPAAVRDARLGYIAAFTQTLFQGISSADPLATPTPAGGNVSILSSRTELPEPVDFSAREINILRKAERKYFALDARGASTANRLLASVLPSPSPTPTPAPGPPREEIVLNVLKAHPEVDFDILVRGVTGAAGSQSYVPDLAMYAAGIERGNEQGRLLAGNFRAARSSFAAYTAAAEPLRRLSANLPEAQVRTIINEFRQRAQSAEATGDIERVYLIYVAAWREVLNSPVLTPRRVNANFVPVTSNNSGSTMAEDELRAYLRQLDTQWIVPTKTSGQFLVNSGRVAGMSLAFLNLMVMRASPNYTQDLSDPARAGTYIRASATQVGSLAPPLVQLAERGNVTQIEGAEFTMASLSSGYSELTVFLANDIGSVRAIEGYRRGQEDALKTIKDVIGTQIPGLAQAPSIIEAANAISRFVRRQQLEIERLGGLVTDLREVVKNLNRLLEETTALVAELRRTNETLRQALDEARETMRKLGRTSEAVERAANAGAGFIVGGPIGAAVCAFLC